MKVAIVLFLAVTCVVSVNPNIPRKNLQIQNYSPKIIPKINRKFWSQEKLINCNEKWCCPNDTICCNHDFECCDTVTGREVMSAMLCQESTVENMRFMQCNKQWCCPRGLFCCNDDMECCLNNRPMMSAMLCKGGFFLDRQPDFISHRYKRKDRNGNYVPPAKKKVIPVNGNVKPKRTKRRKQNHGNYFPVINEKMATPEPNGNIVDPNDMNYRSRDMNHLYGDSIRDEDYPNGNLLHPPKSNFYSWRNNFKSWRNTNKHKKKR